MATTTASANAGPSVPWLTQGQPEHHTCERPTVTRTTSLPSVSPTAPADQPPLGSQWISPDDPQWPQAQARWAQMQSQAQASTQPGTQPLPSTSARAETQAQAQPPPTAPTQVQRPATQLPPLPRAQAMWSAPLVPRPPQPVWLTPAEFAAEARKRKEKRDQLEAEMRSRSRRHERSPSIIEIPDSPEPEPARTGEVRRREGEDGRPPKRARVEDDSGSGSEPPPSAPERREAEAFFNALSLPPASQESQNGGARIEEIPESPERPTSTQGPATHASTSPERTPATQTSASPPPAGQAPRWATQSSQQHGREQISTGSAPRPEPSGTFATHPQAGSRPSAPVQPEKNQAVVVRGPASAFVANGHAESSSQANVHAQTSTMLNALANGATPAQATTHAQSSTSVMPATPSMPRTPAQPRVPVPAVQAATPSTPGPDPKLEEHERRLAELEAQLRMLRELIPTPARPARPSEPSQANGHVSQPQDFESRESAAIQQASDPRRERSAGATSQPASAMDIDEDVPTASTPAVTGTAAAPAAYNTMTATSAAPNGPSEGASTAMSTTSQSSSSRGPQATAPVATPPQTSETSSAAQVPSTAQVAASAPTSDGPTPPPPSAPEPETTQQNQRSSPPPPPPNTQAPSASQSAQQVRPSPPAAPDSQTPTPAAQPTRAEPTDDQLVTLKSCLAFMESQYRRADREREALVSENEELRKEVEAMKLANARLKLRVQITRERQSSGGSGLGMPVSQPSIDQA
ncbi:F5/8 type C domain protein [Trichosporon asahii var. asahii CBS 2479]|uniref:F5/8 type C domain protein n=1 Tax=Trichosporon asahii var. asahii (strain ATCC 90039 / CBS 2479 / JCM 2466 / KCTC 7840 / NBRC 103889/ NCYC 2677 / UAMH 7654) TaxID=1186058 RepID=J6EMK6_TRIAS|nr:F5/8 type C domain protein [Trichosporon asahii var. asahii CBS 2479]EJT45524.1 F5/8 type C domain protein [Trichosporon asahii var. asahii CBS 2479]